MTLPEHSETREARLVVLCLEDWDTSLASVLFTLVSLQYLALFIGFKFQRAAMVVLYGFC